MAKRFVTLTYHRVTEVADPLRPDQCHASVFANQLSILDRYFNVLPLARAVEMCSEGRLPSRAVCITFDDGYLDNYTVALGLLKQVSMAATFFVATGYLGDGMMWNDRIIEAVRARSSGEWDLSPFGLEPLTIDDDHSRIAAIKRLIGALRYLPSSDRDAATNELLRQADVVSRPRLMMSPDDVRGLAREGMDIGGHTVSHPILSKLDDVHAQKEMAQGRTDLQSLTEQPVSLFAYPNGKPGRDYESRHQDFARDAGFSAAFSTAWGYSSSDSARYAMPRVGLEMETGWRFAAKLARAFFESEAASAQAA